MPISFVKHINNVLGVSANCQTILLNRLKIKQTQHHVVLLKYDEGLRPSLHAAARQMEYLPFSLAALYEKVSRTGPALLRALVTSSEERLAPTMEELGHSAVLPGWQLWIVDGNHLPSGGKRLGALRRERGAALPGFPLWSTTSIDSTARSRHGDLRRCQGFVHHPRAVQASTPA